jgi:hypothetical protein
MGYTGSREPDDLTIYTDRACLDSDLSWLRVSCMPSNRVFVHLWAMYAVFWFASGRYGCAGVCVGLSVLLIFYP